MLGPLKFSRISFSSNPNPLPVFQKSSSLKLIPSSSRKEFPVRRNFHSTKQNGSEYDDHPYRVAPYSNVGYGVEFPSENFSKYMKTSTVEQSKAFSYLNIAVASAGLAIFTKNGIIEVVSSMAASAAVLALANIEVDLEGIPEGTTSILKYRGKPLFVRHRTPQEILDAQGTALEDLKDPAKDEDRAQKPEWLVVLGVCTHLGCVPIGGQGEYNGWFCPCHGSHYDISGRIRKGPAPLNLEVPDYTFLSDSTLLVGSKPQLA